MKRLVVALPSLFVGCCLQAIVVNETSGQPVTSAAAGGSTGTGSALVSSTGTASATGTGGVGGSAGTSSGASGTGGQTSLGGASSGLASSTGAPSALFLAPVRYMVGESPHALTTLFLAADGGEDLAVSNSVSGNVTVLLNSGEGAFTPDTFGPFPVSSSAIGAICSAYFVPSDTEDLAVVSVTNGNIAAVLLGDFSGDFGPPLFVPSPLASPTPLDLISGDWNGDGNPDIALVDSSSNTLQVAFGLGDGGFSQFLSYQAGARTYALTSADLDGKDGPDIAVANNYGGSISVFLNDGGGIFNLAATISLTNSGVEPEPVSIAAGDFDGKNGLDLAVVDNSNGVMCILLNDGDGGFVEQAATYPLGAQPQNVVTADFNGDGNLDLAVPVYNNAPRHPSFVAVLLGNGDGTFRPAPHFSPGVGTGPIWIVTGDFNDDGWPDLATANFLSDDVSVFLNSR